MLCVTYHTAENPSKEILLAANQHFRANIHLFSYAKGYQAEWQDPNGELMGAVKARGGKILKRG